MYKKEPRIFYKPLLLGLTKSALQNASFLSAASFQETSRVLSLAAFRRRVDFLSGLKENLILGTRLPIGTNSRFFTSNALTSNNYFKKSFGTNLSQYIKKEENKQPRKQSLFWLDALCYLKEKLLL
jgi:hypothetical protein